MNSMLKPQLFDWLCIGVFVLTALFMVGNNTVNQFFLWGAVPVMLIVQFFNYKKNGLSLNFYEKRLMQIFVWITLTLIVSVDYNASFTELKLCWGAYAMIFIIKNIQIKHNMVYFVLFIYVIYMLDLLIYAQNNFVAIDITSERADDDTVNANLFGYCLFFFNAAVYLIGENKCHWISKIFKLLHFTVVPLSFYLGLITASRQIMLINIPFFIMLSCIRYKLLKSRNLFVALGIIIVLGICFSDSVMNLYDSSLLRTRTESDLAEDNRYGLIVNALQVGFENPLFGVGPNCFAVINHGMSHNSYLELFANSGLIAMFLYCNLFYSFIRRQYFRYSETKDTMYLVFFVFGIVYAFYNCFYVFYRAPWLIMFFMIVCSYSEQYHESRNLKGKEVKLLS